VLDGEVLISYEAFNFKSFVEGGQFCRGRRRTIQDPNCWRRGALGTRMCRKRRRSDAGNANSPCDPAKHLNLVSGDQSEGQKGGNLGLTVSHSQDQIWFHFVSKGSSPD